MHDCPECGMACDCDGDDTWNNAAQCTRVCEYADDDDVDEFTEGPDNDPIGRIH